MFAQAERQSLHITTQVSNIVLSMVAGQYRELTLPYKDFFPIRLKRKEKKRETMTMAIKVRLILVSVRPKMIATGPVTLLHLPDCPQQLQLLLLVASSTSSPAPAPRSNFPHPNHDQNRRTAGLCCRSAFDGRQCAINHCSCYHFPSNLSSVPREMKTKLKNWVKNQPLVE